MVLLCSCNLPLAFSLKQALFFKKTALDMMHMMLSSSCDVCLGTHLMDCFASNKNHVMGTPSVTMNSYCTSLEDPFSKPSVTPYAYTISYKP